MTEANSYKDTVNLPNTKFDMRANAVVREPELQQFWQDEQIYEKLSQENPGEIFVLHDGPPYANGALHMGHALNKILKDIINKYQLLVGRKVRYVPGWDCHGLPIELKVLQNMKQEERQNLTPLKLRHKARDFALKAVAGQAQEFKRYAIWGDWENPYLTLTPEYEAAQIGVFGQMVLKGYIYRGVKPVHWSPSSQTALAEAELEYPEGHTSRSLYAAFPITKAGDTVQDLLGPYLAKSVAATENKEGKTEVSFFTDSLGVAIWTTTPWTIPGNLAVAVNPDLSYSVVAVGNEPDLEEEVKDLSPKSAKSGTGKKKFRGFGLRKNTNTAKEETTPTEASPELVENSESSAKVKEFKYLIVATDLVERLSQILDTQLTVKVTVKGKDLEHCTYRHPLFDRESPIVIGGDYITTESGTGLVHTAPGHGQEDFIVGQRYGLPILSPVDENGNFTEEAGKFAGLNVLKDANEAIIAALKETGSFLKEEAYIHKYPYDWRTKKPTIFRATEQWFASVAGFRDEALAAIANVQWIPPQGENRITPMVADRSDWCISRQRSWGVPIPVFYDEETNEPLLTAETITHVQTIIAEKGSDAWWEMSVAELLPESYRNNGKSYRKGNDTMDVWFDSGSSWAAVAKGRKELQYPADIYLEGSDQHRGWFQSSLLTSVANNGIAPYKTVLTHGFIVDEQGRKMSKSLGNGFDPSTVIAGGKVELQQKNKKEKVTIPAYGADILRLWVSSVDYAADVPLSTNILKQLQDVRGKIRNTARFLLGNLHDFDPAQDAVPYQKLPELDRYMLHRMTEVFAEVKEAFETYQFFRFFQTVQNFCTVDLSNFYLDIAKDRLYISHPQSFRRRSCQTVLAIALENIARAIAPVLCHTAEDIWQYIPYPTPYKSVFESGWVKLDQKWHNPPLGELWTKLRQIRDEVNKVMEKARSEKTIGASLEAKVLLYVHDGELRSRLEAMNPTGIRQVISKTDKEEPIPPEKSYYSAAAFDDILDNPWEDNPETQIQPLDNKAQNHQLLSESPRETNLLSKPNLQVLSVLGLIVAASITLKIALAVLDAINNLPILPTLFQLIGIGYTFWFGKRYLLFAKNRQDLSVKIQDLKLEIVGVDRSTDDLAQTNPALIPEIDTDTETESTGEEVLATEEEEEEIAQETGAIGNGVDELRYLFLASGVEILESIEAIEKAAYSNQSETLSVGVVTADGEKCDRCWNYSTQVGKISEHPAICDRCVSALAGEF
ncbi:MAG TPA: isoleucine--tRNA ligase [Cyanobacteria bacterium UBA11149]|nr:isoleucine--tRNA ligase [Cyanobacteria bacterium UBA11367]HBE57429.1 isoleucine--tRNA ligase [Cyanobacteria bacterium UBA11366]HBK65862.1 isoleucine--tRNA ligase [Cyanobacteria bacterium UBA11166]HBR76936.1 isoleucine--tRNA ligase [Cyanobacteria bacterium UBA11159]HBS71702.1 isoleucine--tRNA ligase [Cyanobacteria bacterium UBA11153]HBW88307.1 isoleucine--tRNA ligase [Cyanobacteria bacterium UBA11149]